MRLIDADELKTAFPCGESVRTESVRATIDHMATVDAKPARYGRWQVNEMFDYKDMTCLSCGWLFEYYNGLEEEWNYCPHCGTKMDGVIYEIN